MVTAGQESPQSEIPAIICGYRSTPDKNGIAFLEGKAERRDPAASEGLTF
jgi:hypothetical protein